MTRFSRVTFNAAHKYLGLTTEVLRTEKAINDIACHPLPPIFYEGGGMQQLRQRFDGVGTQDLSPPRSGPDGEYYGFSSTVVSSGPRTKLNMSKEASTISPAELSGGVRFPQRKSRSSRHLVQAGDLHSSVAFGEAYGPLGRSLNVPHPPRRELYETPDFLHLDGVDFDLRQEVMNCIAVSIGLSQPPLSANTSGEASPSFSAVDSTVGGRISRPAGGLLDSPFGSLSLLDIGDDSSSATGGSSSATAGGYMSGLDNEVEILFFSSGSYLAKAGERDIGLYLYSTW